jgi:hypothetical protein
MQKYHLVQSIFFLFILIIGMGTWFWGVQSMWRYSITQCYQGWAMLYFINFVMALICCSIFGGILALGVLTMPCWIGSFCRLVCSGNASDEVNDMAAQSVIGGLLHKKFDATKYK